jgi:hypothetical protein
MAPLTCSCRMSAYPPALDWDEECPRHGKGSAFLAKVERRARRILADREAD